MLQRMEEVGHQQQQARQQQQQQRHQYQESNGQSQQQNQQQQQRYYPHTIDDGATPIQIMPEPFGRSRQDLDYEDRVNARFSRQDRRARLRSTITYGAEVDLERREMMEEEERRRATNIRRNAEADDAARWMAAQQEMPTEFIPQLVSRPIPIVNFRVNSDFPGSKLPASQWVEAANPPMPFDDAEYSPCVQTQAHVLVPCHDILSAGSAPTVVLEGMNYMVQAVDEMVVQTPMSESDAQHIQQAYWLQDKIQDAIYGQVRYGTILQKLPTPIQVMFPHSSDYAEEEKWTTIEYITTSESVAIKELNWEFIRTEGPKLAEDPIKEVASMQYLKRWVDRNHQHSQSALHSLHETEHTMEESHICMPLDLLSDDTTLYSITPFCNSGRLLDQIEHKARFSEPEARYWMRQILKGISCLKKAGVVHRDMSPENLMVHDGKVYIIDLGMALRIPAMDGSPFDSNSASSPSGRKTSHRHHHHDEHHHHQKQRSLILPQSACGKWYYLSPEVLLSEQPFDGPAVDLWAAGVILFIMLTGLPPWEEPKLSDENFKLMSTGYLIQILTERRVGLSGDAMDLLQRMFWLDPADRLSLDQVLEHPWMTHRDNLPLAMG